MLVPNWGDSSSTGMGGTLGLPDHPLQMWMGQWALHVYKFSSNWKELETLRLTMLELLKQEHPDAQVLVHPESPQAVVAVADVVGSTSQLINAVVHGKAQTYIVATDNGILHRMRQLAPTKRLIEAPTSGSGATCKSCAHCPWMAMNATQGVVNCLENGSGEVTVEQGIRGRALACIERMLDFVKQNPEAVQKPGFVKHLGAA